MLKGKANEVPVYEPIETKKTKSWINISEIRTHNQPFDKIEKLKKAEGVIERRNSVDLKNKKVLDQSPMKISKIVANETDDQRKESQE